MWEPGRKKRVWEIRNNLHVFHHVHASVGGDNRNRGKKRRCGLPDDMLDFNDILRRVVCRVGARPICRSSPARLGCEGDTC